MKRLTLLIISIMMTAVFIGCEVTDVDIETRIEMFEDDLNNQNWNGIEDNFSAQTQATDNMDSIYWTTGEWNHSNWNFFDISAGSSPQVKVTHDSLPGTSVTWTFEMVSVKDGFTSTWYIRRIINQNSVTILEDYM